MIFCEHQEDRKNIEVSDFTYQELENLEEEIKKRKKELDEAQYKSLINDILKIINKIKDIRYDYEIAYYSDNNTPYDWGDLYVQLRDGYAKRQIAMQRDR